jgi:methyl-accepting chemotaxis protein
MRFNVRTKLMAACLSIGLIPLAIIAFLTWRSTLEIEAATAAEFANVADDIVDKIDRNLFERYGDVQAFGFNRVVQDRDLWYRTGEDNTIARVMNQYVDTYDIYYLTLLVDLEGKVIAVNTADHEGKPVDTAFIYEQNFKQAKWFDDALSGRFYESADKSFTGTVVENLYIDPLVKTVYGDEGLSLGFTAPVRDSDGNVIAIWKNIAKLSVVEEIVQATYRNLKSRGLASAELTVVDGKGNVIVDYDPLTAGTENTVRNMEVIGKLNLIDSGIAIAEQLQQGIRGSTTHLRHARKGTYQCAGFSPSKEVLGFPGMGWRALVRAAPESAFAVVHKIRTTVLIVTVITALVVAGAAWVFAASLVRPINGAVSMLKDIAQGEGDLTKRLNVASDDELGELARWFNTFVDKLQTISHSATTLGGASAELSSTAGQMTVGATRTTDQSSAVAAAAEQMSCNMREMASSTEQMSANVKMVATAVEEMTASIGEVAKSAERAAVVADQAVKLADNSNVKVGQLGSAADEIGKVIEVIQDIAEQTNLLALNATIEAARAGDAGKGFAVVATEVKELAKQTATATEDIRQRIVGIQSSSTEAVQAIGEIAEVIKNVNSVSRTIAAAVEEQRITTSEIAKNVSQSSKAAEVIAHGVTESATASIDITRNISGVDASARETAAGASQTQSSGEGLSKLATELQTLVNQFRV